MSQVACLSVNMLLLACCNVMLMFFAQEFWIEAVICLPFLHACQLLVFLAKAFL